MNALVLDAKQTFTCIVNVCIVQYFVLYCTVVVIFKLYVYSTCRATITSPIKRTAAVAAEKNCCVCVCVCSSDGIEFNNSGA
jgi:hypothetical protein